MKLKNLVLFVIFFQMSSCKTMLQCSIDEQEKAERRKANIEVNAIAALRNYYDNEAVKAGGQRIEISNIIVKAIKEENDSTKVTFVVNGKYRTQGLSDTSWTPIVKEESTWLYEKKENRIFITKYR